MDGQSTYFLYSDEDIIVEYDSAGNILASYIHGQGIDEVLSMTRGGNAYYYSHDGLGSVSELTDVNENVVEKYSYSAFGEPTVKDAGDNILTESGIGNSFLFTGREWDSEGELYYYRNRYYNPNLGRFLSKDPLNIQDENDYLYCLNNPINYIDPSGFKPIYKWEPCSGIYLAQCEAQCWDRGVESCFVRYKIYKEIHDGKPKWVKKYLGLSCTCNEKEDECNPNINPDINPPKIPQIPFTPGPIGPIFNF